MFIFSKNGQRGSLSFTMLLFCCLVELQSPIGEWVLTDVADNSQRGTSERIREKMVKMSQVVREAERRVSAGIIISNS